VVSYRAERTERQVLPVNELELLDRARRRDTSFLVAASWLCLLLLAIALGWVGANARSVGTWIALTVVLSAFAPCLWLIHRGQRP
jgi:predicted anti-sigma-YlaC factor YlaD